MAVRIRLARFGRKKKAYYRLVVADKRSPRDGAFIEQIGHYDPMQDPAGMDVKEDRALYWLGVGATPSDTVRAIFKKTGVLDKFESAKK
ncbi:MAG: 30S ribosomal protein S16 [Synergistota bacterium]|nr:30S ribosomal protein S16 [Synergistota bacterium]